MWLVSKSCIMVSSYNHVEWEVKKKKNTSTWIIKIKNPIDVKWSTSRAACITRVYRALATLWVRKLPSCSKCFASDVEVTAVFHCVVPTIFKSRLSPDHCLFPFLLMIPSTDICLCSHNRYTLLGLGSQRIFWWCPWLGHLVCMWTFCP